MLLAALRASSYARVKLLKYSPARKCCMPLGLSVFTSWVTSIPVDVTTLRLRTFAGVSKSVAMGSTLETTPGCDDVLRRTTPVELANAKERVMVSVKSDPEEASPVIEISRPGRSPMVVPRASLDGVPRSLTARETKPKLNPLSPKNSQSISAA